MDSKILFKQYEEKNNNQEFNFIGADFSKSNLQWTNLSGINFNNANFKLANLRDANLSGTNFSGANLQWANLNGANLSGANFSGANLCETNLKWTNSYEACFIGANLYRANLYKANFIRANLSNTNLIEAKFDNVNVKGAIFNNANLSKTTLIDIVFENTQLANTCLDLNNKMPDSDLSKLEQDEEYVIGYRTKFSHFYGGNEYIVGNLYEAPFFSTDLDSECHPGIYIAPLSWLTIHFPFEKYVKVKALKNEVLKVSDKYRAKKIWVLEDL